MWYSSHIRHIPTIMLLCVICFAGCDSNSITIKSTSNTATCGPLQINGDTPPPTPDPNATPSPTPVVKLSPSKNDLPGERLDDHAFMRDIVLLVLCVPHAQVTTITRDFVENQLPQALQEELDKRGHFPGIILQPVRALRSYAEPWLDNQAINSSEYTLDPVIRFGNQAIIVYHLLHTDSSDARDDKVVQYMINNVGEINGFSSIKILAAAPDWYVTGTCGGCDTTRGQPGGPPAEPTPPNSPISGASITPDKGIKLGNGQSLTVYVLDTGYGIPASQHSDLGQCPYIIVYTDAQCLASSTPLRQTNNPQVRKAMESAAIGGNTFITNLESKVDQWDQQLPTDSAYIAPPTDAYPDVDPNHLPSSFDEAVDHGLFISSLINQVAPAASIELMRVLNDNDFGEMSFLLRSLQTIYEQGGPKCKCIINLSLAIGPLDAGDKGAQFYPVQLALDSLRNERGAMIIAAAGNYISGKETAPHMPTFPALFCGVVSVSSGKNSLLDTFSAPARDQASGPCIQGSIDPNASPVPAITAKPTTSQAWSAMATGNNVCGVYLHPLPYLNPLPASNPNYLALWSGTSFAAALASGYAAATGTMPSGRVPLTQVCLP